jgi:A/G-specific adenine glycosylase
MDRFPTVEKLAAAPLERVLELWSGLGYYRRARLMHQAAQQIVARFNGEFPAEYELARLLPGVGDYTARAVLSIAYQKPLFALDGNVARVIARLRAMKGNVHQTSFRRSVEDNLQQLFSRRRPGDFNQAIMQLGQLVCLPRGPRCEICPLGKKCMSHLLDAPEDYPEPRPRRASELHFLAVAIFRRNRKVALVRGLDEGLLDDLWNFPAAFGRTGKDARKLLAESFGRVFTRAILTVKPDAEITHTITHRRIQVEIYVSELVEMQSGISQSALSHRSKRGAIRTDNPQSPIRWISLNGLRKAAVSRLTRKIADAIS